MKNFFRTLFIISILALSLTLSSCSKRNNNDENNNDEKIDFKFSWDFYDGRKAEPENKITSSKINREILAEIKVEYTNYTNKEQKVNLTGEIPLIDDEVHVIIGDDNFKANIKKNETLYGREVISIDNITFLAQKEKKETITIQLIMIGLKEGDIRLKFDLNGESLNENHKHFNFPFKFTPVDKIKPPNILIEDEELKWNNELSDIEFLYNVFQEDEIIIEDHVTKEKSFNLLLLDPGRYTINVKGLAPDKSYTGSDFRSLTFTILPKPTMPVFSKEENLISWNEIEGVSKYEILINGVSFIVNENSYRTMGNELNVGHNTILLRALSYSTNIISSSYTEQTIIFEAVLKPPKVYLFNEKLNWAYDDLPVTFNYQLYKNSILIQSGNIEELVFDLDGLEVATYMFSIQATSNETYLKDSIIKDFNFEIIKPPKLYFSINDYELSWEEIEDARGYEIIFQDNLYNVTNNSFNINPDDINVGENLIKLKPIIDQENKLYNSYSEHIIIKLNSPVINSVRANIVWEQVQDATFYDIYIDDELVDSTNELFFRKIIGQRKVKVVARSDKENVIDSDFSNELEYLLG